MTAESRYFAVRAAAPWLLTALRIALAPFLWSALLAGAATHAVGILVFSCLTDAADGRLARRLKVSSRAGLYFDATADFIVVAAGMLAFARNGLYPDWCAAVVVAMYAQFVGTSLKWRVLYDPLGRYYGGFLLGLLALSVALPETATRYGWQVLVCFTVACIVSRSFAVAAAARTVPRAGERMRIHHRALLSPPS